MKKFLVASALLLVASISAMANTTIQPNFNIQTNDDLVAQPTTYTAYGNEYTSISSLESTSCSPIDNGSRYTCSGMLQSVNPQKTATESLQLIAPTGETCTIFFSTVPGTNQIVYDQAKSSCTGPNHWLLSLFQTANGPSVRISQNW